MQALVQTGDNEYQSILLKHSDIEEKGIKKGSLLTYINPKRGHGGIFHDSKVLLYEYDRKRSIKGVIINKLDKGKRIGGPVEQYQKKVVLHNIPNVKGSVKVIDGVYWHQGDRSEIKKMVRKNSKYQMNEYYGYSSWFEG